MQPRAIAPATARDAALLVIDIFMAPSLSSVLRAVFARPFPGPLPPFTPILEMWKPTLLRNRVQER